MKQRDPTIVTSQDWLESFGLGSRQHPGAAPKPVLHPPRSRAQRKRDLALAILQRAGKAPPTIRTGINPSPKPMKAVPANSPKARRILQREQDDKIDSRAYQSALVYTGEPYKDSGKHWTRREPADKLVAGRQRSDHPAIKAANEAASTRSTGKAKRTRILSIQHQLKLRQQEN